MVILNVLSTILLIWNVYIPQSAELIRIVAGDSGIPPYQIQVLPGGTEIEFRGGLRAGLEALRYGFGSSIRQVEDGANSGSDRLYGAG